MTTITGLVLTLNGERLFDKCLASLDFCDDILVVDSHSTDRTVDIAKSFGARVLTQTWEGPAAQFKFALKNIDSDWIVSLDQDEYLDPNLKAKIIATLRKTTVPDELVGYYVNRRSFYFNRFIKHSGWYPDRLLRVFRSKKMKVTVSGAHYHFNAQGETSHINGDIVHYPYRNFREHLNKINSYAEQGAVDLRSKGCKGGLVRALLHAKMRFIKIYILKLGFLDGKAGLINALAGFYYTFQKYIRVHESSDWGSPYNG